ncbi:preprotein translocase subunit SecG [Maledivibacter halophilus]|uniref:Protein-export membrane protein SecG n=1 Tax=Maledivibacter halophilus TaxID=36842 RepID=A0A1T5MQC0_9FIRM|nr:preprotein translocase subunit SecG [Maledivibacter halophilus]SKC90203.1 preprotein translocase subunit SecG [Maledivibacter halophilus]
MRIAFMVVQVIASLILIISILLQSGKSAGLSGSISGGAEQLFGKQKARGYDETLAKVTKIGAAAFIICSLILVYLQG